MGLDMYLRREKWIGAKYQYSGRKIDGSINIAINDKNIPIDFNKLNSIVEEVAYWRKANAIHKWFVNHVQNGNDDCGNYTVSLDDLKELLEVCKKVQKGNAKARELLPTQDGFFFGSTDYDEWYYKDIDYTVETLEEVIKEEEELNENGFYSDFTYHSSW